MSGLIGFLKDFLPNVQNIDYQRSWEDLKASEKQGRRRGSPGQTPVVQGVMVEYTEEALTFFEWRQMNKQLLEAYWDRRMVPPASDDRGEENSDDDQQEDDWDEDESSEHEDDGDEGENDQEGTEEESVTKAVVVPPLESQPPIPQTATKTTDPPGRKRRIPPLYQAIHSVKTLAYLDLTSKDVSVDLCRVTKVWRRRTIQRGMHYLSSPGHDFRQRCCVFPGRMPRTIFGHLQDDGPLGCCYDHVLSLEIEQLLPTMPSLKRFIRIFLYNAYAKAASDWMDEHTLKGENGDAPSRYIVSLSKIPAKCVLPHALDPRDWWDQEHVLPYCICIGDDSDMILQDSKDESGNQIVVRMDSAEMQVRIRKIPISDDLVSELVLSPNLFQGPAEDEEEDGIPPNDQLLKHSWKKFCQTRNFPPAPPVSVRPYADQKSDVPLQGPPINPPPQHHPVGVPPPARAPVIPNFSTTAAPLAAVDAVPPAPLPAPAVRAPPNHPPPPSPVHRPLEPMNFDGPARKRSQISDVTNLPNPPTPLRYECMSALLPLYEESRRATVRQQPVVNLYGVVVGFTVPSQTKRGDWMCHCNLVDETCTVPVTLLIFTREVAHLPQFQRMGDVLRMHRVLVGQWSGNIQLTGRKESSFVVVRCTETADRKTWMIEPTATKEFHFETADEQRSQNLWHWGQKLIERQPTMLHAENKFTLGSMTNLTEEDDNKRGDRDLTVMVTAKIPYPVTERTSISAYGFMRVWDGTGQAPSDPLPLRLPLSSQDNLRQGDPPPTALSKIASIIRGMKAGDSTNDESLASLQVPESTCGKVANVIIWERHHWNLIENHVPIGTFLRLRNVDVRHYMNNGFRSLMVHSRSWLSPLPDTTYEVKALLKEHDRRVKRNEYNPASGLLPSSQPALSRSIAAVDPPAALVPPSAATRLPLGDGLAAFVQNKRPESSKSNRPSKKRRKDSGTLYKGIVRLLSSTVPKYAGNLAVYCNTTSAPPLYQCFVTMMDASNISLPVLVAGTVGNRLFGVSADEAVKNGCRDSPYDTNVAWKVSIQGVWKGSKEFFILKDIEQVHPEKGD